MNWGQRGALGAGRSGALRKRRPLASVFTMCPLNAPIHLQAAPQSTGARETGAEAAAPCLRAALGSVTSPPPHSPALPKTFHPRSLPLTHVDLPTASRLNLWFPWKKPYSRRPLGDSQRGAWYYSQMMFHPLIPYVYIM